MPLFGRRRAGPALGQRTPASADSVAAVPRQAAILNELAVAVIVVRPDQSVEWLNRAARRLFTAPERAGGRPLIEVVRDHRLEALVARAVERRAEEMTELDQASSDRTLRARAFPLAEAGTVALVVEDVSRLRRLETVRQQFVANLSHELRTPLAGLDLAAQTLASQLPGGAAENAFLDRILKEAQRLTAILNNLIQLAALDAGETATERERFCVRALLEENVARSTSRARAKGIRLWAECPEGLAAWGDPAKTDQALQSILDNALKFTDTGEVVLTARRVESLAGVEISVRDTGVGIPAQDLPRIFERFYKVDRARSATGSGLGLAIARHLVELQGGTLAAESTPGVGTAIRLCLLEGPPGP